MLAVPAIDPGLATFYDRTVTSQINRDLPVQRLGPGPFPEWLHPVVQAFAAGLALLVAFVPRRRTLPQIAALSAAVLIAVQLTADHWFYLYIPWFFGLAITESVCQADPARGLERGGGGGLRVPGSAPARSTPRGHRRGPRRPRR